MKLKITVLILLFLITSAVFAQNVVEQVKLDTLKKYLRELSGDAQCVLDGNTYTIRSRHSLNRTMNYLASKYIRYKFQSYGLPTYEQPFSLINNSVTYPAQNIYAVQPGSQYPDKELIICAHYDDTYLTDQAPGADDNGSGTCAVLEAARVISKLAPKYTIIYALWSGEEQGLLGSAYYAGRAKNDKEDIIGVINMDMIGWDNYDHNNLAVYDILNNSKFIGDMLSSVNVKYNINLILSKYSETMTRSDNHSFFVKGYPEICMIENSFGSNPNYHKFSDLYSNISLSFYEKCVKLAIGTLAELSGIENTVSIGETEQVPTGFALYQNYPNPFNPSTVIAYNLKAGGHVQLKVFDMLGREIETLVDQYQSAGKQQITFSMGNKNLTSGIYLYKLQADNLFQIRKMVYMK